jgi:hypothetical protein
MERIHRIRIARDDVYLVATTDRCSSNIVKIWRYVHLRAINSYRNGRNISVTGATAARLSAVLTAAASSSASIARGAVVKAENF